MFFRSEYAICIFIELRKAFDTVNHSILLEKLRYSGIWGNVHKLFTDNNLSLLGPLNHHCGASLVGWLRFPFILGPLLFILYMNDIVRSSNILKFLHYADDTSLVHHTVDINELVTTVNTELDHVAWWFFHNQLVSNVEKTNYVIFCSRPSTDLNISSICIGECVLVRVYKDRFLGIILDPQLISDLYLFHVSKELAKFIPIMKNIRNYFNTAVSCNC